MIGIRVLNVMYKTNFLIAGAPLLEQGNQKKSQMR